MKDKSKYGPGNRGIELSHPEEDQRNPIVTPRENYSTIPENSPKEVEERMELSRRRSGVIRKMLKSK